jgi:acetyl-CoA carboxylase alpha subunit
MISLNHLNQKETKVIQPLAESIIPFVDTSTAEKTASTLTTEDHALCTIQQSNMITKIVDQQIQELASEMSAKYEKAIQTFQLSHTNQLAQLSTTEIDRKEGDDTHLYRVLLSI